MNRIVLTGGGTAGHVTPNLALLPLLEERGYDVRYIGSKYGIEMKLAKEAGIPYYPISSGKLRRYLSAKNITDAFRVIKGRGEAKRLLAAYRPDIVFSKGGFVSVPVVTAAKKLGIPVIIHESDMTPGLANRMSFSAATRICCNFPETLEHLPKEKSVCTGCPIRQELSQGSKSAARAFLGFNETRPVLMIVGGSLGSVRINKAIRAILPQLLKKYQVCHICGKGNLDESLDGTEGYVQLEYVTDQMKDLLALADLVVSRAGANMICELLYLQKPMLLIPLSAEASRGDQILNAKSFRRQGFAKVLFEEQLKDETLLSAIADLDENREYCIMKMKGGAQAHAATTIVDMIDEVVGLTKTGRY